MIFRNYNLIYLAKPRFGGWVTFTAHLKHALEETGAETHLYRVGKTRENVLRDYGYSVKYNNLDLKSAVGLANTGRTIITAIDANYLKEGAALLKAGARLVIHDPTEMKGDLLQVVKDTGTEPIVIRAENVHNLAEHGIKSHFIKHPYVRHAESHPRPRVNNAVSFSRLDWDKHIHIMAGASLLLPPNKQISIHGFENRLYTHHKLTNDFPNWRDCYHGAFGNAWGVAANMAGNSNFVVDMSVIKGDGGGSQYTFLEAWDGESVLVVNRGWLSKREKTVEDGVTAIAVSTAEELADLMKSGLSSAELKNIIGNTTDILNERSSSKIVGQYDALFS